jgi:hypothetical protein
VGKRAEGLVMTEGVSCSCVFMKRVRREQLRKLETVEEEEAEAVPREILCSPRLSYCNDVFSVALPKHFSRFNL